MTCDCTNKHNERKNDRKVEPRAREDMDPRTLALLFSSDVAVKDVSVVVSVRLFAARLLTLVLRSGA